MNKQRRTIIRPLLTEKMLKVQDTHGHYAFVVHNDANKIEIKQAVERKFDVTVDDVRTVQVKGKRKQMNTRRGLTRGRRSNWKKAIVTLREGDSIDFFE
jgi:large subunit ribosomal protein L23